MKYGGKYWNIKDILPYQRHFNFINSIRNMGKSYTTAGFFVERFLKNQEKFILLTRTAQEKKEGALSRWVDKVMFNEFPEVPYTCLGGDMYYTPEKDKATWKIMGYCRSLSEAIKVKKQSFVNVRWGCLEEYMLEPKHSELYVKGWREPDLLLNIYHTIDREEDKLTLFMLGNNTAFYNPYHLHPAFNIPPTERGEIWKSENVLFQFYEANQEMVEAKKKNKFLRMIEGTEYGSYALEGNYIGDKNDFIEERSGKSVFCFNIRANEFSCGVWSDYNTGIVYLSNKTNTGSGLSISIAGGINVNERGVNKQNSLIKWLAKNYMHGMVFYETPQLRLKGEEMILKYCI